MYGIGVLVSALVFYTIGLTITFMRIKQNHERFEPSSYNRFDGEDYFLHAMFVIFGGTVAALVWPLGLCLLVAGVIASRITGVSLLVPDDYERVKQ